MIIVVSHESVTSDGRKGCSGCGRPRDRKNQRYCKKCHTAYMQKWREGKVTVLLTPEQWEAARAALAAVNGASGGR